MNVPSENTEYIFVASFRHPKTGKIIHASKYGKKAFRIKVRDKRK